VFWENIKYVDWRGGKIVVTHTRHRHRVTVLERERTVKSRKKSKPFSFSEAQANEAKKDKKGEVGGKFDDRKRKYWQPTKKSQDKGGGKKNKKRKRTTIKKLGLWAFRPGEEGKVDRASSGTGRGSGPTYYVNLGREIRMNCYSTTPMHR